MFDDAVQQRLAFALGNAAAVIERIDPTERITDVAIAARIVGRRIRRRVDAGAARGQSRFMIMRPVQEERQTVVTIEPGVVAPGWHPAGR